MLIFIHGYGTSGIGPVADMLKKTFGQNVYIPALKHEPLQDIRDLSARIMDCILNNQKVVLIGSSLGGFYAKFLSARLGVPAILINPALSVEGRLTNYGTFKKYDCDDTFIWSKQSTDELAQIENEMKGLKENLFKLHFFVATDDELIDHSDLKNKYPFVKEYDNCGHRFMRFEEIIPNIKNIYEKT